VVAADAPGDGAHPATVRIELEKGALHVAPGAAGAHLVAGHLHADDPTLAPHVTVNARGVSLVQDFAPAEGVATNISWDLTLGTTPMRLFVHVAGSEDQRVDLGGRPIVTARLYNEGGHLDLDWSAPNPRAAERIELWSIGYLEAHHVARSGAKRIEVKNVGLTEIDLGDRVDTDVEVDVVNSAGTLVVTVPRDVAARAVVDASVAAQVEAEGWSKESPGRYALGTPEAAPRVTIAVRSAAGLIRLRTTVGKPR